MTDRQQQVLDYLRSFRSRHGYSPTVRDIVAHFGLAGPNSVRCHLLALRRDGHITWQPHTARSITLRGGLPLVTLDALREER